MERNSRLRTDPAQSLDAMRRMMEADRVEEKNQPILTQKAIYDNQIIVSPLIPFTFNSLLLTVLGGVVAVTFSNLQGADNGFGVQTVPDDTPWDFCFGSAAFNTGSATIGINFSPIVMFTGPQEIRFAPQQQGYITLWVHPFSQLAARATIDPNTGTDSLAAALQVTGRAMYIP